MGPAYKLFRFDDLRRVIECRRQGFLDITPPQLTMPPQTTHRTAVLLLLNLQWLQRYVTTSVRTVFTGEGARALGWAICRMSPPQYRQAVCPPNADKSHSLHLNCAKKSRCSGLWRPRSMTHAAGVNIRHTLQQRLTARTARLVAALFEWRWWPSPRPTQHVAANATRKVVLSVSRPLAKPEAADNTAAGTDRNVRHEVDLACTSDDA